MPVEPNVFSSKLQIRYNYGVDGDGNPVIKTKSYSSMKKDAADQVIYDVATAIAALQANTLEEVHKVQDVMLINL